MTDNVTHLLDDIDGHPVTGRLIKLTKAGDGLSEALKINAVKLHVGDEVTVILKGVVGGPTHKPRDRGDYDGDYLRVDNIVTTSATIVESGIVDDILTEHEAAVAELRQQEKERREGLKRLPLDKAVDEDQANEDGVTPDNVTSLRE
jgi:hypothetical protein